MNGLIVLTLLVHVVLLWAPFDIYFVSPVVNGMTPIKSDVKAPAKRVVLMVADGLRAEAVYDDDTKSRAPFLSDIKNRRGSWGVSHTRVPTESRPGHVAILAGIYEDPSAILHGWKVNPVSFDTVINESRNAWCWGSPDIVDMFNRDRQLHIHIQSYDSSMQDFGKENTTLLDDWVFERVYETFKNRRGDCGDLCDEGNLFFLHLLGIDTAGHAYKPHSNVYSNNIMFIDRKIREIEALFENFFGDNSTAYVFTADHGMTDWGSHGAGTDHETEVPFIAWGSGIKTEPAQQDLNQADIAPLLAVLIGRYIPVNSVGTLPHYYLDVNEADLSDMVLANVKQLLELYNTKRMRHEENLFRWMYRPYPFHDEIYVFLRNIENRIAAEMYSESISISLKLIRIIHGGLDYFHTYFQKLLLSTLTSGILIWIVYLIVNIKETFYGTKLFDRRFLPLERNHRNRLGSIFGLLLLTVMYFTYSQSIPLMYTVYLSFPIIMTGCVLIDIHKLKSTFYAVKIYGFRRAFLICLLCVAVIECLVQGFFNRFYFSTATIIIGFWIWAESTKFDDIKLSWLSCNVLLAVFTALPIMNTQFNIFTVLIGIFAWFTAIFVICRRNSKYVWDENFSSPKVVYLLIFLFIISSIDTLTVAYAFHLNRGLHIVNQMLSWMILATSLLIPFLVKPYAFVKIFSVVLSLVSFYVLVAVNYEALFLLNLCAVMYLWMHFECKMVFNKDDVWKRLQSVGQAYRDKDLKSDLRNALFYLVFIFVGFFGTGNIASLNSFDPMWVRCFLTVFSPFTMSGLIVLKIMVPFLIVTCTFRTVTVINQRKKNYSFHIVLIFTDFMLLHFLYYVKTEGSWLEIGMSLSHYLIFELITIVLILLYGIAYVVTAHSVSLSNISKR